MKINLDLWSPPEQILGTIVTDEQIGTIREVRFIGQEMHILSVYGPYEKDVTIDFFTDYIIFGTDGKQVTSGRDENGGGIGVVSLSGKNGDKVYSDLRLEVDPIKYKRQS